MNRRQTFLGGIAALVATPTAAMCVLPDRDREAALCARWQAFYAALLDYREHEERSDPLYEYRFAVMAHCRHLGMPWDEWGPHAENLLPRFRAATVAMAEGARLSGLVDDAAIALRELPVNVLADVLVRVRLLAYSAGEQTVLLHRTADPRDEDEVTENFRRTLADIERLVAVDPASAHLLPLLGIEVPQSR